MLCIIPGMNSRYDHQHHEEKIYALWRELDAFNPDSELNQTRPNKTDKTFTIMMPPPNANDALHIGHATFLSLEDIMIRYHRMLGDDTLWLPGTDHAGIETQFLYEKKLKKNKQSRFDFDRQTLYQNIWDYVQENSDVAVNQMKRIGASADWSRFRFMLEPELVDIVLNTFKNLHDQDLVYRDQQLVNYCTNCGTSFSELEVEYQDQDTPLYYVKYPMADNPAEHIIIATVRPEPIFADTHLAVHPKDEKNHHLIGKHVLNPITDQKMTIIADEFVDPDFGTGIVKLTPAHDPHDFEVAKKHDLPINQAFDLEGKLTPLAGKYAGMRIKKARAEIVEELKSKDLIDHIDEKYHNRIGCCYRCKRPLEPLPLPQFFVRVRPLVEPILKDLEAGNFTVHGAGHDKILKHWLENLRDWNISRQIVWGIQMPIWYDVTQYPETMATILSHTEDGKKQVITASIAELQEKGHSLEDIRQKLQTLRPPANAEYTVQTDSPGENFIRETDTFDTWFSSSQWPFSTLQSLGTDEFNRFYPTQVMETGYDILPFWVMRMLFMGKFATGKLPFTDVYLHGLVRDEKGLKMSKSKGNVINPLEIIDEFGADSLRMALTIRSSAGLDKSVGRADFKAMRNFTNKLWNASRFILLMAEEQGLDENTKKPGDESFQKQLNATVAEITQQLNDFKLGLAAETAYNQFWHWFCDECIEATKDGQISLFKLTQGLLTFLSILHPFVPFVTEAIWQTMAEDENLEKLLPAKTAIGSAWPTV